jgi:hypothetical protein
MYVCVILYHCLTSHSLLPPTPLKPSFDLYTNDTVPKVDELARQLAASRSELANEKRDRQKLARLLAKVERDRQAKVYALAQYTSGHMPKDGARSSGGFSRAGDTNGSANDKSNVAIDRRPSGGSSSSASSSSVSSRGGSWREYEWCVEVFVCFRTVPVACPVNIPPQLTISRTL